VTIVPQRDQAVHLEGVERPLAIHVGIVENHLLEGDILLLCALLIALMMNTALLIPIVHINVQVIVLQLSVLLANTIRVIDFFHIRF